MCAQRCPCDVDPNCLDCGRDTDTLHEYYMVRDRLWLRAVPKRKERRKQLCIGCLEKRLGRRLTRRDFTKAPVNRYPLSSPRLRNRQGIRWRKPKSIEHLYRRIRTWYCN